MAMLEVALPLTLSEAYIPLSTLLVPVCNCIDSDAEQPRKRKLLRRHSAPVTAPVADQMPDVSADASESVPPVISNVMMVEVENVVHDPYKTTEEMKVSVLLV